MTSLNSCGSDLRLLHGHHAGEDQLLTPKLIERKPGQVATIRYIAAHRTDMDAHLPAPVAAMWADTGHAMFDQFIAALRA